MTQRITAFPRRYGRYNPRMLQMLKINKRKREFQNRKSFRFDGIDDYIEMGDVLDFEITDSFSLSAWVKGTDTSDSRWFMSRSSGVGNFAGYRIYAEKAGSGKDGEAGFLLEGTTAPNRLRIRGTTKILDGNWHHVLGTYDGSNDASGMNLYVDGVLETKAIINNVPITTMSSTGGVFQLSGRDGPTFPFSQYLDEPCVWDKEMSADEAKKLYNNGVPGNPCDHPAAKAALLAWWRMGDDRRDDATADTGNLQDQVGGFHGTPRNTTPAEIVTHVPLR